MLIIFKYLRSLLRIKTESAKLGLRALNNVSEMVPHIHSEMVSHIHSEMVPHIHSEMVPHIHSEMVPHIHSEMVPHIHSEMVPHIHADVVMSIISYVDTGKGEILKNFPPAWTLIL